MGKRKECGFTSKLVKTENNGTECHIDLDGGREVSYLSDPDYVMRNLSLRVTHQLREPTHNWQPSPSEPEVPREGREVNPGSQLIFLTASSRFRL